MLENPKAKSADYAKISLDETMDNQQATEAKMGWLAGIIDGEGCITMRVYKRTTGNYWRSCALIVITNTSKIMLEEIHQILSSLRVGHFFREDSRKTVTKKRIFSLRIDGLKRCQKFLPLIIPYLIAKRPQAEVLLRFVNRRIDGANKRFDGNCYFKNQKFAYTEEDRQDIQIIRTLNHRGIGVPNDYKLPPKSGRYSLNSKETLEKQAEMTCSVA